MPPTPAPPATGTASVVAEAAARLRSAMSPSGPYAVLLSIGSGPAAASAGAALRRELLGDPRVVFSEVRTTHEEPVADPSTGTGHVHLERQSVEPWPAVVVSVSESDGQVFIAARPPGGDPLGPADQGWTWVLPSP